MLIQYESVLHEPVFLSHLEWFSERKIEGAENFLRILVLKLFTH